MLTGVGGGVVIPYLNKVLGPSADELGVAIAEHARIYRLKNAFRLFKRANEMTAEAGFEPQQVSMKALLPLLEGASLEDDESLADKWAALLANAANPDNKVVIKPAYADILRQLTTQEAQIMDKVFDRIRKINPAVSGVKMGPNVTSDEFWQSLATATIIPLGVFRHLHGTSFSAIHEFNALADNLLRQRLLVSAVRKGFDSAGRDGNMSHQQDSRSTRSIGKPDMNSAFLSALGFEFMLACTPPQATGSSTVR